MKRHQLHVLNAPVLSPTPGSPKWYLSRRFPNKPCIRLSSTPYVLHATYVLILFNFITQVIFGEQYRSLSSSVCKLHSLATSSLISPNILNTLFSNTLIVCFSCNMIDHVPHPYKTAGKIIVLYILIFIFLKADWKTMDFAPNDSKNSLTSICS